jgi:hypothetical protein
VPCSDDDGRLARPFVFLGRPGGFRRFRADWAIPGAKSQAGRLFAAYDENIMFRLALFPGA